MGGDRKRLDRPDAIPAFPQSFSLLEVFEPFCLAGASLPTVPHFIPNSSLHCNTCSRAVARDQQWSIWLTLMRTNQLRY
jgi:hypothetical protein